MADTDFTIERIRSQAVPIPAGTYLYFLLRCGEVVYVGQSNQLWGRAASHCADKAFDQVAAFPCDPSEISILEAEYILRFRPEYNVTIPLNPRWLTRAQIKRRLQVDLWAVNRLIRNHKVEQIGEYYNFEQLEARI